MVSTTKGARITGDERQRLMLAVVRRYLAGESIRSLATDTGRSYGFVQGLLKEAGVPLRARGGATRGAEAEADRLERQVRVDALRAAEPSADFFAISGSDVSEGNEEADMGLRDLDRSPTPPADWGLPTPPLGVLVNTKKDKRKAKKLGAGRAKPGDGSGKDKQKKAKPADKDATGGSRKDGSRKDGSAKGKSKKSKK